jgi:hypothetical protein
MPTPKVNSWLGWRIFTVNTRSFIAAFQTSMPPLSPPWSIGSYWTDVYMDSYASFYYALLTCIIFLCRWRPKTHSFHLPCGEKTITLQDAAMFLGLGIRGRPMICSAVSEGWRGRVEDFLGAPLRTMCGSRTGGWSLHGVMSDWQCCVDWFLAK